MRERERERLILINIQNNRKNLMFCIFTKLIINESYYMTVNSKFVLGHAMKA
jgi:hypothetical protein